MEAGIIYEPPRELTTENVVFWSDHYKMFEKQKSVQSKARNFLENDCIKWDPEEKVWICKPIAGYNKTTHRIFWNHELINMKNGNKGEFECSCQGNNAGEKICSHILALYMYLKILNYNKSEDYPEEMEEIHL